MKRILAAMLVAGGLAWGAPVTQSWTIGTRDAPVVTPRDHGTLGRNVRIEWTVIGPGPDAKGDALYAFCVPQNPDRGSPLDTPAVFMLDLTGGRFVEYYPKTLSGKGKMAPPPSARDMKVDELGDETRATTARQLTPDWYWERPTCAAVGARRTLLIGTQRGEVVRFHPARNGFEEILNLNAQVEALCETRPGELWAITSPGNVLHHHEEGFGLQKFAGVLPSAGSPSRPVSPFGGMGLTGILGACGVLAADNKGWLYTAIGPAPWRIYAVREERGRPVARPLLAEMKAAEVELIPDALAPALRVTPDGGPWKGYRLAGGAATPADLPSPAAARGYDLETDFDHEPPSVWVTRDGRRRQFPFQYSRATVDDIKCMTLSADGTKIYGAAYPNATIFEYDIAADRIWRRGKHYVHYQMLPDGDWIYSIGYWGIKLMRWDPRQPWTFDYEKHYFRKQYPGSASPWGSLDCNPQLICKFRYLRYMNLRRPAGLAKGADGRWYTGGRDMGINLDWRERGYQDYGTGINYAGALFWFDPREMTIGYEVGDQPFQHYAVRDLCAAGNGRYICMTATRDSIPFEPPLADAPGGVLIIWDTQERRFVHRSSPWPGHCRYIEEGAPGLVVIQYSGALAVFDLARMETVRLVKVPLSCRFTTYGSPVRFERGPDEKIYFYGTDKDGTALFRFDSRSGQVEAVARGPGISEVSGTGHPLVFLPGSTFLFTKERVYFATSHLWSVPLERLLAPGVPARPADGP